MTDAIKRTLTKPLSETIGTLVSRNTGPVIVTYGEGQIRFSTRGKSNSDIIRGLLPHKDGTHVLDLPVGVVFMPNK